MVMDKGLQETADFDEKQLYEKNNRQGSDLRQEFDFIKVPIREKRGDSASPNREAVKPDAQAKHNRESRRVIEPPLRDKWLNIKWITPLA